jgi:NitT/TauT family transport system substrate-binding protein
MRFAAWLVLACALACNGAMAEAPAKFPPVKFALDWVVEGSHAVFAEAVRNNDFTAEGLSVTIDRGFGSGDTINKVANGSYEFGYANINAIPPFNAKNPGNQVICVFVVYDGILNSIIARKAAGIQVPRDLEGKSIADAVDDDSRLLFPVYAKAAGIDAGKINWISVSSNLRDAMLAQKRADAVGAISTALLAIEKLGVPSSDLVVLNYTDVLPALLRSGIIVSAKTAAEKPELVAAFVRAVAAGELQAIHAPEEAAAAIAQLSPLIDVTLETDRFRINLAQSILTANVRRHGLSYVTPQRLTDDLGIVSAAYGLPIDPAAATSLYTDRFLPPRAALQVTGQ